MTNPLNFRMLRYLWVLSIFIILISSIDLFAQKSSLIENNIQVITDIKDNPTYGKRSPEEWLKYWSLSLNKAEQALHQGSLSEKEILKYAYDAEVIQFDALGLSQLLQSQYDQINDQFDALGPKPDKKEVGENLELADKRRKIKKILSEIDAVIKSVNLVSVRAKQLNFAISVKRRDRFVQLVLAQSESILSPRFWSEFLIGLTNYTVEIFVVLSNLPNVAIKAVEAKYWFFLKLVLNLIFTILGLVFLRKKLIHFAFFLKKTRLSPGLKKVLIIINDIVRIGVIPALFIVTFVWLIHFFIILLKPWDNFLLEATFLLGFILVINGFAVVIMNPYGEQRIINVSSETAKKVYNIILSTLIATVFFQIVDQSIILTAIAVKISLGFKALFSLIVVSATIAILVTITREQVRKPENFIGKSFFFQWAYIKIVGWITCFAIVVALCTGYLVFAELLAWQVIFFAFALAVLWVVIETFDQCIPGLFIEGGTISSVIIENIGVHPKTVEKFGKILAVFAKFTVTLIVVIIMFLPWGISVGDWYQWISNIFFGFEIGNIRISFYKLLLAVLLFTIGYVLTRIIQNWLDSELLSKTSMDMGLSNSIRTVVGYAGTIASFLVAFGVIGLNLSNLAIVAGALSVGIGFGLQSIVNNFVSGLILLAERPMKKGDWIITAGGEGMVSKISVRSTEIETFDGATIIVPNSTLITDPVTNWTHSYRGGRISINIGVAYNSNPHHVREILLKTARSHNLVMQNPAPYVIFKDFGADMLLFQLRAYLSDIEKRLTVSSDLRFELLNAFRAANIEIPYPQRDIHIKSGLEKLFFSMEEQKKT